MHMLYNSDSFSVVQFDMPGISDSVDSVGDDAPPTRGGFEIVDKFARKEIFIEGALAASFMAGVEALIQESPSEEELDDYIGRFSSLMQQPLTLH
ncbi:DUF3567 domain-containing protein [soil metagenome]